MRIKLLISLIILTSGLQMAAQDSGWSASDYKGSTFKEFAVSTQSLLKIRIYYYDQWVNDIIIGEYPADYTLPQMLGDLFKNTSIYFYTDKHGNIILTKNFAIRLSENNSADNTGFIPPSDYSSPGEKQQNEGNKFAEVGNPAERDKAGKATISGYITDSDTKEPVSGVTVFNPKLTSGTTSNEFGYYSITMPRGIHTLQFSFIGMKEKTINLNLFGNGELNMEMKSELIPLKETVVSAQKGMILQRFEGGVEKINLTSFRLSPTSLGESDIVKNVLLIPGVKSVGEGSAGFNVRGGSADQNLILLYGAPVYNASHFFGFFSAVNSEIIKDATLYKGGIPARYGGRISSVLDIGTIDGNTKEFHGTAGISPITTQLKLEGPLIKDTLSYILTARTTYSDWIFKLMKDPTLKESTASFYDLNLKVTYDINKENKLEFASYLSHDSFRFGSDTLYRYNNNIFSLRWRHIFNKRFFSSFTLNNSYYKYDVSSYNHKPESFILSHSINSTEFNADFNWFPGRNEINFGTDVKRYTVLPGSYLPAGDSSLVTPVYIDTETAYESSVYIEDKFRVTEYLSINAGLRLSTYFATGPATVYVYSPGFSKTRSTITDTLNFGQGEVSKIYTGPEMRVSFNFRTSVTNSLKLNYNRTRQYLHLLSNTTSISPTDTWKLCDYNIKPQIGDQVGMGFYQVFSNNSIEASAEVYYKKIQNMVDFKGGAKLLMNENIEQDVVNVEGKAYGLELLLKKTHGKLLFSLGYTYSRAFIRSLSTLKEEVINDGQWFPSNFDKPSDLVFTLNYFFSRRFSFSTNYTWSTGRPVTYPVATYSMYDEILVHYSDRNKYRIPEYSRLDLSFNIAGSLRKHKLANPNWTFSVYNLLGRNNVYSVYFKKEGDEIMGYQLSVFANAIPSVTFSFDF
ncbi:MAG: TonB-dependent receptor [Bacteroidia bacterium]|nr:TonB-dependent receptor [Bacteroidia bacterium]